MIETRSRNARHELGQQSALQTSVFNISYTSLSLLAGKLTIRCDLTELGFDNRIGPSMIDGVGGFV